MSTFSSLGVGAGVDLQSLLTKIMTAERAPLEALKTKISSTTSKISMYGTMKSKLDALMNAADTLRFPSRLSALKASSGDASIATATATFVATPGSYSVQVVSLATTQKSNSAGYTAGTTFSAGTMTFTVGDPAGTTTLHPVTLSSDGTLSDVRNAINAADFGVKASIVTASDGKDRLVLTSTTSGKAGTFSLVTDMVASGMQAALSSLTDFTTAQDGEIEIDGISITSANNEYTSAVPGVTFTAKAQGTTAITVATDGEKLTSALKTFVESYNEVVKFIKDNSKFDLETRVAGAFNGDSAARSLLTTLASTRTTVPAELASAPLQNLFEIGVSVDRSGFLSLDTTKLNKAIAESADDVTNVIKAYGTTFSTAVLNVQSAVGIMTNKVSGLNTLLTNLEDKKESLEYRLENIEKGYRRQFTALDRLVSQMQTTSSYLGQQLASLSR